MLQYFKIVLVSCEIIFVFQIVFLVEKGKKKVIRNLRDAAELHHRKR